MFATKKLKDPRTCRIFFSSPFGGMEEEREELTRKYFPQINHLCNGRGIQFVPVDMRWGITAESADNAQVLSICLRELDRSDIFVGFFGQRYGWHSSHGSKYDLLQKNFDNTITTYPWVDNYRDRSVTEIEFRHGHLNNPGSMPTCIYFRSKKFDDEKYKHYSELEDKKTAMKYVAEGNEATEMRNMLKREVENIQDKCLDVHLQYEHPHQCAKRIFTAVWKYLNEILEGQNNLTLQQKLLLDHDTFMMSKRQLYVTENNYFQQLDDYIKNDKSVLISGSAGSGKSALLSNWIDHLSKREEKYVVLYHFIACGKDSGKPRSISFRLNLEVKYYIEIIKSKQKCPEEKVEESTEKSGDSSVRENINKFRELLEELTEKMSKKVIIIVDAVEKAVKDSGKVTKSLYWLPDNLPRHVSVVVSCLHSEKTVFEELVKKRHYEILSLQPLSRQTKHEICVQSLQRSGKAFSSEQLKKVVTSEQTSNPLFLQITLHELSVFGYFRKLDEKIESLIACESIEQLFDKYLDRMESDYNVKDYPELVKLVFSALHVSHEGLSESELQDALDIPKQIFSPLYFAMEKFLICHSGPLWFAFSEMKDAIKGKYLKTEEDRVSVTRKLINFFERKRKRFSVTMDYIDKSTIRLAYELPWLQRSIDDKEGLAKSLVDLYIFSRLYQERDYELLELWKSTGYSFIQYSEMFEEEFNTRLVEFYLLYLDGATSSTKPPGIQMLIYLEEMKDFLELAICKPASLQISLRIIAILNNMKNVNGYEESSRQKKLANHKYELACTYCDIERFTEAKKMHYEVVDYFKIAIETGDLDGKFAETRLGWCYNGLGLIARYQGNLTEAKNLLQQSHDIHVKHGNRQNIADALQNLGLVSLDLCKYEEAIEIFKRALKIYEDNFFGTVPHIIGNLLTNLGLCYRRQNDLVTAEKYYFESLQVKANAVGWDHPVIAVNYMNLGTLEMIRKNWKAAEEYAKKCIEIYKINLYPEDDYHHRRALENILLAWLMQNRYDAEVKDYFWRLYNIMVRLGEMDHCLPGVHHRMAKYYIDCGGFEEANKILVTMMNSKKKSKTTYLHMDELDSLWTGWKPDRPVEMTLDYALEKLYENSSDLKNRKLQYLISNEDIKGILTLLQYGDTDFSSEDYADIADHCVNNLKAPFTLGINILQQGLKVCPQSQRFVLMLINFYHDNNQFKEAYQYVIDLLETKYTKHLQEPSMSHLSTSSRKEAMDSNPEKNTENVKYINNVSEAEKRKESDYDTSNSQQEAEPNNPLNSCYEIKNKNMNVDKAFEIEKNVNQKSTVKQKIFLAASFLNCGYVAMECQANSVAEHFFNKVITTNQKIFIKQAQEAIAKHNLDISEENKNLLLEDDPNTTASNI